MPESERGNFSFSNSKLNRHLIMYGESIDYDTEQNSLKTISLLSYLHWISRKINERVGEKIPDMC